MKWKKRGDRGHITGVSRILDRNNFSGRLVMSNKRRVCEDAEKKKNTKAATDNLLK